MMLFYKIMHFIAGSGPGIYLAEFVTWCITSFYFFMPRPQVKWSMAFYQALFPGRSRLYYLLCAWRQFHHFSTSFTDRLIVENKGDIVCESIGIEHIYNFSENGRRGILLMSHVGNWELAARKLAGYGINVALFVGSKQAQKIESQMKKEMLDKGLSIISVDENEDSPLNVLQALNFVRNTGFISITGDRLWSPRQKAIELDFLGGLARIPHSPFALAYALKVPMFVFFIIRTGRAKYRIEYNPPIVMDTTERTEKETVIRQAAGKYLLMLEDIIRKHPEHWYCFEPFIFPKRDNV